MIGSRLVNCGRMVKWSVHCALACAVAACGVDNPGHAPISRIVATPKAIPEHDDFHTDVVLDGSGSSDPIDDPDGGVPLDYSWDIAEDPYQLVGGTLTDAKITVRFQGERPATVRPTRTQR